MLTSKQRASLRAMANNLEPVFQIGKGNLSEVQLLELNNVLNKRELIKLTALRNCEYSASELLGILSDKLNAEPVAAIGNKLIIYRRSDDKSVKHIEI